MVYCIRDHIKFMLVKGGGGGVMIAAESLQQQAAHDDYEPVHRLV